jgi:O-antigen/teichoic acid export membrane protein
MIREKLTSRMGKDVVWTFVIQFAIMLCAFVITKLLSNRLSIEDFGQYNIVKRSVQVMSFVMLAGVGIALPRYIPLYQKGEKPKPIAPLLAASFIYIIGISMVVCLICGVFSGGMQRLVLGDGGNTALFIVALAYAFTLAMAQLIYAYYRGTGNFKWYNSAGLLVSLSTIVPLVALPILTTMNVFASWLIVTTALVVFFFVRELRITETVTMTISTVKEELRTIIKYSSGRMVADFFLFSLSAFPLIYISNSLGLQPTAYYSVGVTFVTMVTPLYSFMGIILLPYVSECIAKKELGKADCFINRLLQLYVASSLAITALLYLFTEFFTWLFFSPSYIITADLSRIMILAILPQSLYLLYRNPIDAVSDIPYNTIILGICLVVMIMTFTLASTLTQLAWAYTIVSALQGQLTWLTWLILNRKFATK